MQYRKLGDLGLRVSEIGYGGEHLVGKPYELVEKIVNTAIDGGVNIIDVFMPQAEVRSNLGKAIGKRRKDIMLQGHIGSALQSEGQYVRTRDLKLCDTFVKDFLTRFDTNYIDFGMIHYVDTENEYKEAFESPYIEYVQKLKKDGIVRYLGASTHDTATAIKMVNSGIIDMIMFSVNPVFDLSLGVYNLDMLWDGVKLDKLQIDPLRAEFYNLCTAKGIGITVMKALGAGRLLKAETSSLNCALTVNQCVSYALDRPAVSSVLLGAQTVEEIRQCLAYESSTAEERSYMAAMKGGLPILNGLCMYCNHCLPCASGIDIAAVTKHLDTAKIAGVDQVKDLYSSLSRYGSNCIGCGTCEKNCPFGIKVIENMKEAARVFGK
ncbi:MAG: aldo/keto reductase [Treponema sp.]|nr:aldo/keto reductase [Treponema sp.]